MNPTGIQRQSLVSLDLHANISVTSIGQYSLFFGQSVNILGVSTATYLLLILALYLRTYYRYHD